MGPIFAATIFVLLIAIWFRRQKEKMRFFKRIGIPGPTPHFIKGNIQEIDEKGLGVCHKQWVEKYGRIVGYYIGCRPFVLIADPELLKLIEIKNFSDFSDRRLIVPGGTLPVSTARRSLAFTKGRRWMESRSVLGPAFTSGKLRKMYVIMENCVKEFLQALRVSTESSDTVDMKEAFMRLSMDVICSTAFGIKTDVQRLQNNPFVSDCEMAMSYDLMNTSVRITVFFPELQPIIGIFRFIHDYLRYILRLPSTTGLLKACSETIEARRSNVKLLDRQVQKCDLLQLMMDSKVPEEDIGANEEDEIASDQAKTNKKGTKSTIWHSMSDIDIQANVLLFLLAGHHTTSTCLAYTTYVLSMHQEIQNKLREDVKSIVNEEGDVSYDDVMALPYMDQVVNESLRLYPPVVSFTTRESTADFSYKGITLPKDTAIQAAVAVLHHDAEYWKDPQTFDPERFSPENKRNIGLFYQPFGAGRRNCIGMRFALLEIKLTLAKLIHNYLILPSSAEQLKVDYKVSVTTPKGGLPVRLVPILS